ncbi:hypothetical protein N7453_001882 [Penicillium expansum]|nr:hypothetical protein N7453_001882 [Penicillium expansum]
MQRLLKNLYNIESIQEGQQINPSDVMIISPDKAQGEPSNRTVTETKCSSPRGTVVIVLLTKPNEVAEVQLIADKERLNIALGLAVVGNMRLWPDHVFNQED